jgi:type I restriction enzyme S subunit
MEEWKEYRLGEIVNIRNGIAFKSKDFVSEGIPVIKIKNVKPNNVLLEDLSYISETTLKDNKKCFFLRPSDILITMTGNRKDGGSDSWVGKVAQFKEKGRFLLNQRVSALQIRDEDVADNVFLSYMLSSWDAQLYFINHSNSSGGQANISPDVVKNYIIYLPTLSEQKRIATILSSLDSKISINKKINSNLEEQAKALFKSWFIDFEPFKDGKFIDSELGKIPDGWRASTLREIAEITMGTSPNGKSYNKNGDGAVFYQGRAEFGFRFPHRNFFTSEPKKFAETNSTLLSVRAPVGDINMANEKCCIGRGLASIKSRQGYNSFIFYLLASQKARFNCYNSEGTVFGCINKQDLENFKVVIPNQMVINKFQEIVCPIDELIKAHEYEAHRVSLLRDTLLPKLMSGEIDVEHSKLLFI